MSQHTMSRRTTIMGKQRSYRSVWAVMIVTILAFPMCFQALFTQDVSDDHIDRIWLRGGINFLAADSVMMLTLRFRMQNQASFETISPNDLALKDAQFLIRRVRIRMNGFVVDPRLTFLLQLGFSRNDMDFDNTQFANVLRDAMVTYRVQPNFHLGLGLGKLPGNRERVISSGEQQFIDRSIVNRSFNLDRDVGVQAYYSHSFGEDATTDPRLSLRLALSSGLGRSPAPRIGTRLMYTARLAFFPFGNFSNNGDYYVSDLAFEQTPKLYIAGVVSRNDNGARIGGTIGNPLFETRTMDNVFLDGIFKYRGFSLYGEYARRMMTNPITREGTSVRAAFAGEGLNLQAGYFIAEHWELSARYSSVEPVEEVRQYLNGQTQYTLCLTRFLNGHRVKLQSDLTYNILRTITNAQASWILRFQVELGL